MEKHVYEAMFYGGTFAIGLLASLCRLVHERGHRDNRDLAAVSFQGGLWSFGTLGILGHYTPDLVANPWFGLGVAALVGLGGKEQDKYLRNILAFLWSKLGLPKLDRSDDEPK